MPWIRDDNMARGSYRWVYPPGVSDDPPAPARAPAPAPAPAPPPPPPAAAHPEKRYIDQSVKSFEEQMREKELNERLVRDPHNKRHADVGLVKEMRHAHSAIKRVLCLQCERIEKRYRADGLDPVGGALERQYSVTATGTLKVRRVTLKLRAAATASNAMTALGRGTPPGPHDAISWTLLVVPPESPFRTAVNDALAAAGYNNGNAPDGLEQIPVNLDKSLKYALNAIWKKPMDEDEQDGMVEDDLLPDDDADDFAIEEVVDETPDTNAKRARTDAGPGDDSTGVTGAGGRIALPPEAARFFERFGDDDDGGA